MRAYHLDAQEKSTTFLDLAAFAIHRTVRVSNVNTRFFPTRLLLVKRTGLTVCYVTPVQILRMLLSFSSPRLPITSSQIRISACPSSS